MVTRNIIALYLEIPYIGHSIHPSIHAIAQRVDRWTGRKQMDGLLLLLDGLLLLLNGRTQDLTGLDIDCICILICEVLYHRNVHNKV